MIVLLDTSQDIEEAGRELAQPVGQLLTPLTRFRLQRPELPWAIDNGAYSRFDLNAFRSLLEREDHHKDQCKFVACPDVVGNARRTLEAFEVWAAHLSADGWPVAVVAQDGQEDLRMPWDYVRAVFIGGTTAWKLGPHARDIIKTAQILGRWVHVGRVNDPHRFAYFDELGVDSIDGTGISRYSHMREAIARRHDQERLFSEESLSN